MGGRTRPWPATQRPAFFLRQQLHLRLVDRLERIFFERFGIRVAHDAVHGPLGDRLGPVLGLENLARGLAGPEARDADVFDQFAKRALAGGVEFRLRDFDFELDLRRVEVFDGG